MGVDFFPCDVCEESICDCGDYYHCRDICERKWCSKECAIHDEYRGEREEPDDPNDYSCKYCRGEEVEDYVLLSFLLTKYNLTRDQALNLYKENRNECDS